MDRADGLATQNKTSSAVQLKHVPSGIVVKCQATRSQAQNRKIARTLLAEKLEYIEKGAESRIALKISAKRKKEANRRKKAKRKYGRAESAGISQNAIENVTEVDGESTGPEGNSNRHD